MKQTEFFEKHSHQLVSASESNDFKLFAFEERDTVLSYMNKGYQVASVFENENDEDEIIIDNDVSNSFHKIGFYVLNTI